MDATVLWAEWGGITRYLQSSRIAFEREAQLWRSLAIDHSVKLQIERGPSVYEVQIGEHLDAVGTPWRLCSSVLLLYYSLAECAAGERLQIDTSSCGGIEVWATGLLEGNGRSWPEFSEATKGDLVEVAAVRNRIAHGDKVYSQTCVNRVSAAGKIPTWTVGDAIGLDFEILAGFAQKLKSLLREAGFTTTPAA